MEISDENISVIKKEYDHFKNTSRYIERRDQLIFVDFAGTILKKVLQRKTLTNEQLTALIQIFGHGSKKENVEKYIDVLNFEESDSKDLFKRYINLGQTGFTGRGKAAVKGLSSDQLSLVHTFLVDILKSSSEKSIKEIVSKFEQRNIPQVKYGVYSPWLYYLHPTMCPIVAGPVKDNLKKIGWDQNYYVDAWDMLEQIKKVTEENDYGFLDAFMYGSILIDPIKIIDDEKVSNGFENGLLLNKKQMIFYGPPGTGKTYKAREIAVNFIKEKS